MIMDAIRHLLVFGILISGAPGVHSDRSVMEGDSVTLHTDVKIKKEDRIRWFFNSFRISQIIDGQIQICTDEQCKERFKDRLKLNNQTGSLTINNIRNADSGEYHLLIISGDSVISDKRQNITVVVSTVEREQIKSVKEGDPVILYTGVIKNPNVEMRWTFNGIVIAELTDESQICLEDQCKKRFQKRLNLVRQTGDLNITDTRSTDSGVYQLQITRSGFQFRRRRSVSITSVKSFSITVDSGLSSGAVTVIVVAVLLAVVIAAAAAGGLIYKNCVQKQQHPAITYSKGSASQTAECNEDETNKYGLSPT